MPDNQVKKYAIPLYPGRWDEQQHTAIVSYTASVPISIQIEVSRTKESCGLDVVFLIDVSHSVEKVDLQKNRFKAIMEMAFEINSFGASGDAIQIPMLQKIKEVMLVTTVEIDPVEGEVVVANNKAIDITPLVCK